MIFMKKDIFCKFNDRNFHFKGLGSHDDKAWKCTRITKDERKKNIRN